MKGDAVILEYPVYGQKGIAAKSNTPGGRSGSASWLDGSGNIWLMGGNGISQSLVSAQLNDVWKYDPLINSWTWVNGDSTGNKTIVYGRLGVEYWMNDPGSRAGSLHWKDQEGNFWIYGGGVSTGTALWRYKPATNQWTG
jgi:hypothetical protein